jgi:hypothetical protein
MKKNKTAIVATEEQTIETIVAETPVVETPVVAEIKAAEEPKKAPGRPVVEGSARQQRMAARKAALEAGLLKRGRPSIEGSKRQLKLQARAAKIAAGIELKPGRPKMEKPVESKTPVVETVEATA